MAMALQIKLKSKGKSSAFCNATNYIDLWAWDEDMTSSCMGRQISKHVSVMSFVIEIKFMNM